MSITTAQTTDTTPSAVQYDLIALESALYDLACGRIDDEGFLRIAGRFGYVPVESLADTQDQHWLTVQHKATGHIYRLWC